MKAAIALGANLGNPAATFELALAEIEKRIGPILIRSHWYRTAPLPVPDAADYQQPDYLNGAVLIETSLPPHDLLATLHEIEASLGRERGIKAVRWGARALDLDLLLVEDQVIDSETLTLPHAEMHRRDFVLVPLMELCPDWRHPRLNKGVAELIADIDHPTIMERM